MPISGLTRFPSSCAHTQPFYWVLFLQVFERKLVKTVMIPALLTDMRERSKAAAQRNYVNALFHSLSAIHTLWTCRISFFYRQVSLNCENYVQNHSEF